jgi:hypothetical protein
LDETTTVSGLSFWLKDDIILFILVLLESPK